MTHHRAVYVAHVVDYFPLFTSSVFDDLANLMLRAEPLVGFDMIPKVEFYQSRNAPCYDVADPVDLSYRLNVECERILHGPLKIS